MNEVQDRIEKQIHLRAPRSRVWRAISDSQRFGTWFGAEFDGPFIAGQRVSGRIVPTKVDPEVAKLQEAYAGTPFSVSVERVEPERLLSFRWHPNGVDPKSGFEEENSTLVTFELEERDSGTLLRLTESGFSKLPLAIRATAFKDNDGGWTHQMTMIEKYLQSHDG